MELSVQLKCDIFNNRYKEEHNFMKNIISPEKSLPPLHRLLLDVQNSNRHVETFKVGNFIKKITPSKEDAKNEGYRLTSNTTRTSHKSRNINVLPSNSRNMTEVLSANRTSDRLGSFYVTNSIDNRTFVTSQTSNFSIDKNDRSNKVSNLIKLNKVSGLKKMKPVGVGPKKLILNFQKLKVRPSQIDRRSFETSSVYTQASTLASSQNLITVGQRRDEYKDSKIKIKEFD